MPGTHLANHARAQQAMARNNGTRRIFLQRRTIRLAHMHDAHKVPSLALSLKSMSHMVPRASGATTSSNDEEGGRRDLAPSLRRTGHAPGACA